MLTNSRAAVVLPAPLAAVTTKSGNERNLCSCWQFGQTALSGEASIFLASLYSPQPGQTLNIQDLDGEQFFLGRFNIAVIVKQKTAVFELSEKQHRIAVPECVKI